MRGFSQIFRMGGADFRFELTCGLLQSMTELLTILQNLSVLGLYKENPEFQEFMEHLQTTRVIP